MAEPGESSSHQKQEVAPLPPPEDPVPPRRRSRRTACACCALLAVLLVLSAVAVAYVLFRPRNPSATLVSSTVDGVSPRLTLPAFRLELNLTLDLVLLVHNPNRATFSHGAGGRAAAYYRGRQVGEGDVAPGRLPARGSAHVRARLTIEAQRLAADLGELLGDVAAGRVGLDSSARIPGRVTVLGFLRLHAVALSHCHLVLAFPDVRVAEQQCQQRTQL